MTQTQKMPVCWNCGPCQLLYNRSLCKLRLFVYSVAPTTIVQQPVHYYSSPTNQRLWLRGDLFCGM